MLQILSVSWSAKLLIIIDDNNARRYYRQIDKDGVSTFEKAGAKRKTAPAYV